MQDHYWILEKKRFGEWSVVGVHKSRQDARLHKRVIEMYESRIRKFVAA